MTKGMLDEIARPDRRWLYGVLYAAGLVVVNLLRVMLACDTSAINEITGAQPSRSKSFKV